jgi:branched-chain amino acid transport system substrate-binding protein
MKALDPPGGTPLSGLSGQHCGTAFGSFKVDQDGFQMGHRMLLFQWQDGNKMIVWPDELAPGKPRFPTPPWSQR